MKKTFTLLTLAFLALGGANAYADEATPTDSLIFTDQKSNPWGLPTKSDSAGFDEKSYTNGKFTIKLKGVKNSKGKGGYYQNKTYLMLGQKGATLTLPAFSYDVERIDIVGNSGASSGVKENIYVGTTAVSSETTGGQGTNIFSIDAAHQAAGNVYVFTVNSNHNAQITKIYIWKKGTAPAVEIPKADNIAAFKALGKGTKAALTLKDAQVQYVGSTDIYIADATGGIDLYGTNLTYTAGQILNGTITGTYTEYNSLPELTDPTENTIKATDGTVTPVELTAADAAKAENACKLVTIKNVSPVPVTSGKNTNWYTDSEKTLQIYDKFRLNYTLTEGSAIDITGIIIPFNKTFEIAPTTAPVTTGINSITADKALDENAPIYNISGQRVGKDFKGIVIQNGKKHIQK